MRSCSSKLTEAGFDTLPILDIDHITTGGYLRNTLAIDGTKSREDALFDIYRVMRPGEPPTVETAEDERAEKTYKRKIKLDSNIEIQVNVRDIEQVNELIEVGYDEATNRKFYKIYFQEEI